MIDDNIKTARKLPASDEQYLKAISLKERKKSNQALAQHLAESSGTRVDVSTGRKRLVGVCFNRKSIFRKAKQWILKAVKHSEVQKQGSRLVHKNISVSEKQ